MEEEELLTEIREEQQISPYIKNEVIEGLIKDGIYEIECHVGFKIDFVEDRKVRSWLKEYVFYAIHKRLAEFKQLYAGEYAELQTKYNRDTNLP